MSLWQCCYMTETCHSGFPHLLTNAFQYRVSYQALVLIYSVMMLSVQIITMGEEEGHGQSEINIYEYTHIYIDS